MAGLETVIGTHNFDAENGDEISFSIGEVIVVLEKDEGYQDGWWQGRNARGEIGLFPMNYTAPAQPTTLPSLEDKIDSMEIAVTQMQLPKETDNVLPTSSSRHISTQPQPQYTSSSSSASSIQQSSVSSSICQPASYQKKLSSKYVHQSVANSLQNPELRTCLPEDWSVEQVSIWLGLMGFSDMASTFQAQEITGDILLELNVDSLKELDVTTFGKRFKIYNAIKVLSDENVARKEAPDTTSDNNSNHHLHPSSSSVTSSAHSIISTSSNRPIPPSHAPYPDDDLVSDYSTVIRNSVTAPLPSIQQTTANMAQTPTPSSPSMVPADSRRVYSLDSARPLTNNNLISTSQQHRANNGINKRNGDTKNPDQSVTAQPGATRSTNLNSATSKSHDQHHLGRSSTVPSSHPSQSSSTPGNPTTRSRYNFVRNSFLTPVKPQTALPVASRASVDGIAQQFGQTNTENALPDIEDWLHKQGDKYKTWNKRWFVLKGSNLFYFKSPKDIRMKGIINLRGYRIVTDETIYAGKFCFRAQHDRERTFYFYTDTETSMKTWVKTLIKATITRDFTAPVMSSSTVPTVSLDAARRMKPRPPSMIYGRDSIGERPTSPSIYDSRPFSLTYTDQPEPIMRMSMSDETHSVYPLNNQTQESGLLQKEPPAPPSLSPSMDNRSIHHDSGFTSTGANNKSSPQQHRPSAADIFYGGEDEDLIDPHQQTPPQVDSPIESSSSSSSPLQNNNKKLLVHTNATPINNKLPSRQPFNHDRIEEQEENDDDEQQPTMDRVSWQWDAMDYVDWINRHLDQRKLTHVTDLRTGEFLVELLEAISGSSALTSMQMLDNIVAAFKFMGREGVVVDGRYNIKDIFSGNEIKIMEMLKTIKDWADQLHPSTEKMASGGTFGENEQGKLKALDEL
ncbi:hypothetical protein BC941DRAFT_452039 [Chlamydoabsidia padenii]|nr:hypothetical protein BC941DRAFT_452039 [Chlamydoabsidia padenii]